MAAPPRKHALVPDHPLRKDRVWTRPGKVLQIPEDRLHDPRERVDWFARLPDEAKEEFRRVWRTVDSENRVRRKRRKRTWRAYMTESAAAMFLLEALLFSPTLLGYLLAPLFGAVGGAIAGAVRAGALPYALVFGATYVAFGALAGSVHLAYYLVSLVIVICLGAAFGATHKMQRFDGSEV